MKLLRICAFVALATIACLEKAAHAGVTPYNNKSDWLSAIGDPGAVTTIGFNDFPEFTFITDQYQEEGVTFFGTFDTIRHNPNIYPNDDWGLDGNGDINIAFERPIHWIAAEWPGAALDFRLYLDGELVVYHRFTSAGTVGHFSGLYSLDAFDSATLIDPSGEAAIDDLHFVIPAPASIALLFTTLLFRNRSRRRTYTKITGYTTRH